MRCRNVSLSPLSVIALATALATGPTLFPRPASAAGFDLRWDACAADAGVSNKDFACDSDVGTNTLVASFRLDQPLTQVIFFDAVVDFIVANDQPVPPWWQYFEFSDCRVGALSGDTSIDPGAVGCLDWSQGAGDGGVTAVNQEGSIAPGDAASHRRIKLAGAVNPPEPPGVSLAANQDYFVFNLHIENTNTTTPEGCTGCELPVCIVLNSIQLLTLAPSATQLSTPTSPGSNFATWQGGSGANCAAVPVRRSTWSSLKQHFR